MFRTILSPIRDRRYEICLTNTLWRLTIYIFQLKFCSYRIMAFDEVMYLVDDIHISKVVKFRAAFE